MKKCSKCMIEKSYNEFSKAKTKKDGLSYVCKECHKKEASIWYLKNKEKQKKNVEKWSKQNRDITRKYVIEYLCNHPCVDCGEDNILVLDFDHKNRHNKEYDISHMLGNKSKTIDHIKTEIKKCEIRCSNCHRIKTMYENKSWKLKYIP